MINTTSKNKLLHAFVIIASLLCLIPTSYGQGGKSNANAVIKTSIYCDHCKECETCGQLFQDRMLKIPGVKMYDLNVEEETITVFYNPKKIEIEDLKIAISKLGYDAGDVKADIDAYNQLDGCCKK